MNHEALLIDPFGESTPLIQEWKDTKNKVKNILERHPQTRNNDTLLIMKLWETHDYIQLNISEEKILSLTSPSTIMRVRREIQNDQGQLLPTTPGVLLKRRIKESHVRSYYAEKQPKILNEYLNGVYDIK